MPQGFTGATDSAASCAIMLYMAQVLTEHMFMQWESDAEELDDPTFKGIQFIFFDGEEAVHEWTDTDSIYGSRHLANLWENHMSSPRSSGARNSKLSSIDLMVLLDLLGAKDAVVSSFFPTTHWVYIHLANLEAKLRAVSAFKTSPEVPIFDATRQFWTSGTTVLDDHVPFMTKGVEILHVIPLPFPQTWHTIEDDANHLDKDSVRDLTVLFTSFVLEWMEVDLNKYDRRRARAKSDHRLQPSPVMRHDDELR